ncbi:MAG: hypothetical protein ACOY3I_02735 [Verrucomicrobiota bacterium]
MKKRFLGALVFTLLAIFLLCALIIGKACLYIFALLIFELIFCTWFDDAFSLEDTELVQLQKDSLLIFFVERCFCVLQFLSPANWIYGTRSKVQNDPQSRGFVGHEKDIHQNRGKFVDLLVAIELVIFLAIIASNVVFPIENEIFWNVCMWFSIWRILDIFQATINMSLFDRLRTKKPQEPKKEESKNKHFLGLDVTFSFMSTFWRYAKLILALGINENKEANKGEHSIEKNKENDENKHPVLNVTRTFVLILWNYIELILAFGVIYYIFRAPMTKIQSCFDSFLFSATSQLSMSSKFILNDISNFFQSIMVMQGLMGFIFTVVIIAHLVGTLKKFANIDDVGNEKSTKIQ